MFSVLPLVDNDLSSKNNVSRCGCKVHKMPNTLFQNWNALSFHAGIFRCVHFVHKRMIHMHTNSPQMTTLGRVTDENCWGMQRVCAPSRSLSKFPFFFLFRRPFSILLTVAANWFCKEHSHTHQKQSSVMGFRQLSLAFYFCLLKGLSTGTNLKPADLTEYGALLSEMNTPKTLKNDCVSNFLISNTVSQFSIASIKNTLKTNHLFKVFWYNGKRDYPCWLEILTNLPISDWV